MHQLLDILVDRTFKNQCVTLDLEGEKLLDGKPLGTRGLPPAKIVVLHLNGNTYLVEDPKNAPMFE